MLTLDVAPIEGFHPELGLLLASLNDSTREWRENLDGTTIDTICWQPYPKGPSVGGLILHMIECELYWFENYVAKKWEDKEAELELMSAEIKQMEGTFPDPPRQPIEWYYELMDRYRERSWRSLVGADPMATPGVPHECFTVRWVVAHVVEHDSYHGGQAVLLNELAKRQLANKA